MTINTPIALAVVTISKDDPEGLRRTLDSLGEQRILPAQVLLVRRGTSLNVDLAPYAHLACSEVADPGLGISAAFNAGLARAEEGWVMFLNGGDSLLGNQALQSFQEILAGETVNMDMVSAFAISRDQLSVPARTPQRPIDFLYLSHQATIFRRQLFSEIGGYRLKFKVRMDLDWMSRYVAAKGTARIHFIDEPLVRYELDGISSRNWGAFYREEISVLMRCPGHLLRLARLLLLDVPARILSPRGWRRRYSRIVAALAGTKRT